MYPQAVAAISWPYDAGPWSGPAVRVGASWYNGPASWTPGSAPADALNPAGSGALRVVSDYWVTSDPLGIGHYAGGVAHVRFPRLLSSSADVIEVDVLPEQGLWPGDEWTPPWQGMITLGPYPIANSPVRTYASSGVELAGGVWRLTFRAPRSTSLNAGSVVIYAGFKVDEGSPVAFEVLRMHIADPVKGMTRLRQRQTLTGADSWPMRQRQHGGHTGSWSLRQRQSGV